MDDDRAIKNKMIATSTLSLLGVVIVVGGIMYIARGKLPEKYKIKETNLLRRIIDEPKPTPAKITGTMATTPKGSKTMYRKGDVVTMLISADSKGDRITGYDAVLRYDPTMLQFDKVASLVEGLDLYQTEVASEVQGKTDLVVTGIQSISQKEPFLFNNTPLVEVTFMVKKKGTALIDMVFAPGHTTESNLMNAQTQDILSSAQGTTLDIK